MKRKFTLPTKEELGTPAADKVTRDGKPVRIICVDAKGANDTGSHRVVALISDDGERLGWYHKCGESTSYFQEDLFDIPEERAVWLNIYGDGTAFPHVGREEADGRASKSRIACIKVTYKEGEGL